MTEMLLVEIATEKVPAPGGHRFFLRLRFKGPSGSSVKARFRQESAEAADAEAAKYTLAGRYVVTSEIQEAQG